MAKGKRRYPPWYYATRLPHPETLAGWRKRALALAKERGANSSCDICKRPVRQWGTLSIRHPRSTGGRKRHRRICSVCAGLLAQLVDVLEWHGASDNLPPESFPDEPPGELSEPEPPPKPKTGGRWDGYIPRPTRAEMIRRMNENMDRYYAERAHPHEETDE